MYEEIAEGFQFWKEVVAGVLVIVGGILVTLLGFWRDNRTRKKDKVAHDIEKKELRETNINNEKSKLKGLYECYRFNTINGNKAKYHAEFFSLSFMNSGSDYYFKLYVDSLNRAENNYLRAVEIKKEIVDSIIKLGYLCNKEIKGIMKSFLAIDTHTILDSIIDELRQKPHEENIKNDKDRIEKIMGVKKEMDSDFIKIEAKVKTL